MKLKNILGVILLFLFGFTNAQRKPKIKGNKNVIEVAESLPAFHTIELKDNLEINVSKGTSGYQITADDNLIDVLKFRVKDSILTISSFYTITGKKKLEIEVNYENIETIKVLAGKLIAKQPVVADRMQVYVKENAKLELNADAPVMNVYMDDSGSGKLYLDADSLHVEVKNRANLDLYTTSQKNTITLQKNATARIEGTTDTLEVKVLENANLKAQKFEAAYANVTVEASGIARVYAFKDFELSASGSSKTYLYGNPKLTINSFTEKSLLRKEEE